MLTKVFITLLILPTLLFCGLYIYYKKTTQNHSHTDIRTNNDNIYNATYEEIQQTKEPEYNDISVKPPSPKNVITIPDINLTFPSHLPDYKEIISDEHKDPRMLVLFMKSMFYRRNNSFTEKDIDEYLSEDFGGAALILDILGKKGFIEEKSQADIMQNLYTVNDLKNFCRKKNLGISGKKAELIERLLKNGYKLDRRKYRHTIYKITNPGQELIHEEEKDRDLAIVNAMNAIKKQDFQGAVDFFNNYDNKWGFVHISGRKRTIFANYDISHARFEYIANYPMQELQNSEEFKSNLRASLITGLMRGNRDRDKLADRFRMICNENICCPNILDMYRDVQEEDEDRREYILEAMQRNIEEDAEYILKYYISKILYLSNDRVQVKTFDIIS